MRKGQWGRPAMQWEPLPWMEEFLTELEAEGKSEDYIRKVKLGLAHFALFLRGEGVGHPEQIERSHLLRFQAWVNRKDEWARSYQVQLMKYVRVWINWLDQVDYITENPWRRIRVGTVPKRPKPVEAEDLQALFEAHRRQAFSISPFYYHRREVILSLLYGWGLRIHELQGLNVTNLDMRLHFVTVRNKGGGVKNLPYSDSLKQVVSRYLRQRAQYSKVGEDALLITRGGTRLSIQKMRGIITDLGDRAGVAINPHRLRDTAATDMLNGDIDLERVAQILGHSDTRQTLAYARVSDQKVAEDHARVMDPKLNKLLFGT